MKQEIPNILKDFLNYMESIKGRSKGTISEYYSDLVRFMVFIKDYKNLSNIDIKDIDIEHIKNINLSDLYAYMAYITRELDNKAPARARKVASIRSFFNYLKNRAKLIEYNPGSELEYPQKAKRLPKYLSIKESKKLLGLIQGENQERDYAIITLFLNCGFRLSELVNINISKIGEDSLSVIGKGNKERMVYLNNACKEALSLYLKARPAAIGAKDKDALFLSKRKKRISIKTVQHLVNKYTSRLNTGEKYSPHKLRHTAATLLYQSGVDIRELQEILGHESIMTTEIYTHIHECRLKDAVGKNPLANLSSKLC